MKDLKHYFENHPTSNEVFKTADGFLFTTDHHAQAHGNGLKEKEVKKYTRDQVMAEGVENISAEELEAQAKAKEEAEAKAKEEAEAKAKEEAEAKAKEEAEAKAKAEAKTGGKTTVK